MKKSTTIIFLLLLGLFFMDSVHAGTIKSVQNGNWSDVSTWDTGGLPAATDSVVINGHIIEINTSTVIDGDNTIRIKDLSILNTTGSLSSEAGLIISTIVTFKMTGELLLAATELTKSVNLKLDNSGAVIEIAGDIVYESIGSALASINVLGGATLKMAGNLLRPTNFGSLEMQDVSTFVLNGTGAQTLPIDLNILGEDFSLGNIWLNNPQGITLSAPMVILGNLTMQSGNIISSVLFPVIIGDDATITGGSESAYIEGPVTKVGRTNNAPFEFPIGNSITYAPMSISKVASPTSTYTAIYRGDPPPFGVFDHSVLDRDYTQYWELIKAPGSERVGVQLAWTDGAASNLNHLDSVIVVGLVEDPINGKHTWMNYGASEVTGGVGEGESGTVRSIDGDPPPFGVFKFTVGHGENAVGALPVELIKFKVKKDNGKASLEWKTGSELNSVQYEIERSQDGISFDRIGVIKIQGNSDTYRNYSYTDAKPNIGANYYRLRILDFDGSYEYSYMATLSFSPDVVIMIAPNPVAELMTIDIGQRSNAITGKLEVFDQTGKQLFVETIHFEHGIYQTSATDLNVRMAGTYYIRVTGGYETKVVKFIKLR